MRGSGYPWLGSSAGPRSGTQSLESQCSGYLGLGSALAPLFRLSWVKQRRWREMHPSVLLLPLPSVDQRNAPCRANRFEFRFGSLRISALALNFRLNCA